jgi:uncharacterized lipoprotein
MNSPLRNARPLLAGAIVAALLASTGCHWFSGSDYRRSVESRPLEVPPDLDAPATANAMPLPAAAGLGASSRAPVGFVVADTPANTWSRIGTALATIDGVTVVGQAQTMGSYDVSFQGQNFLLRVEDTAGQSRVSALGPNGQVLRAGPASILLEQLRAKL